MINIFKNIRRVFNDNFADKPVEYKDGFMDCYTLFEIAFKKTTQYPLHLQLDETQKELELVSETLVKERRRWEHERKNLISKNEKLEASVQNLIRHQEVDKSQIKYKTRLIMHTLINSKIEDSRKINELKKVTAGWDKTLQ